MLHWLTAIPHFMVDLVLELQDECFGVDHGPIEPGELIRFFGEGLFDLYDFFV